MIHCWFCKGNISEGRCIHCGRSTDIAHELYVIEEQKKPHKDWNTCREERERLSRIGKNNPDGYGRRREE
jgi:hypothetical protein